jgi:antitoxin component of RelBE/YafQ-DinJ toxin-antitoxin module
MDNTILQIPISKALKKSAQEAASEYGFSSLQDLLRVILTKLSRRELAITIEDKATKLTDKNAVRYRKMSEDFVADKNVKKYGSVDELLDDLNK